MPIFHFCLLYLKQLQEESLIPGSKVPYASISSYFFVCLFYFVHWVLCLFWIELSLHFTLSGVCECTEVFSVPLYKMPSTRWRFAEICSPKQDNNDNVSSIWGVPEFRVWWFPIQLPVSSLLEVQRCGRKVHMEGDRWCNQTLEIILLWRIQLLYLWKCWRELKVNPLAAQGLLLYFSFGRCNGLFSLEKV